MIKIGKRKGNKNALYGNKFLNIRDNELILDNFIAKDLVQKYQTPTFIFLQKKIESNIQKITKCFSSIFPNSQGFYSTKANYLPKIVSIVKNQGFGAEIIGLPELNMLKEIFFPFNKVIAGGPYLPDNFLTEIIKNRIKYLVIYDLDDIPKIQKKIQEINRIDGIGEYKQKIIIRIQSKKYTGRQGVVLNEENLKKLGILLENNPNLHYKGILYHMGTQLNSINEYEKNFKILIDNSINIKKNLGLKTEILDIGGGFPNADSLKNQYLIQILKIFKKKLIDAQLDNCLIFYEPGRFIIGDAGFSFATVIKYDPIHSTTFLDIGNNYIPKFMKSSLRFYNITRIFETSNTPIDFMGNIPSDQDILVKNYNFTPSIQTGDEILIANVGAYALTWSIRFPYPTPSIILIKHNHIEIIHDRNSPTDFSIH